MEAQMGFTLVSFALMVLLVIVSGFLIGYLSKQNRMLFVLFLLLSLISWILFIVTNGIELTRENWYSLLILPFFGGVALLTVGAGSLFRVTPSSSLDYS